MKEGVELLVDAGGEQTPLLAERRKSFAIWHLRLSNVIQQILPAVTRAGGRVMVMRGRALGETVYVDPMMRPQSDIDLLIAPGNVIAVKQVLWDLGFRPDIDYPNIFQRGEIMLDTHTEPLGIERIHAWAHLTPLRSGDFFEHSEAGELCGQSALLLRPRVQLPYLCFHAMKHSFERLIWLCDIALLANQIEARGAWDEVLAGIREYRLERPCYYALAYVRRHLAASVPEELLASIRPKMGFVERGLFARHMDHQQIPYLAERLFARMQPDLKHRIEFWRETIYPSYEVRKQIAGCGCVKCNFIRKRLKQVLKGLWLFVREGFSLLSHARHS